MSDDKDWQTVAVTSIAPGIRAQVWAAQNAASQPVVFSPIMPVVAVAVERHPVHGERKRLLAVDGDGQVLSLDTEVTEDRRLVTNWTNDWAPGSTLLDKKGNLKEPLGQWAREIIGRHRYATGGAQTTMDNLIYYYKESLKD